jgi:hypothetical protein
VKVGLGAGGGASDKAAVFHLSDETRRLANCPCNVCAVWSSNNTTLVVKITFTALLLPLRLRLPPKLESSELKQGS